MVTMNYFGNRTGMKLGLFGGTFDPIHRGHIAIAEGSIEKMKLDGVLFMPAGQPWMKTESPISSKVHRLEMVKLAIKPFEEFEVSDIEIKRLGPTYTIDTLIQLKHGPHSQSDIYLILGIDAALAIKEWYSSGEIARLCEVIIAPRGDSRSDHERHIEQIENDIGKPVHVLNIPHINVSGTEIRSMIASHMDVTEMISRDIEEYIRDQGLYLEDLNEREHD